MKELVNKTGLFAAKFTAETLSGGNSAVAIFFSALPKCKNGVILNTEINFNN